MLVLAEKSNQLGNRLLVSAHMLALSAETGRGLINVTLPEYAKFFEGPSRDLLCRYPPRSAGRPSDKARLAAYRVVNFLARATSRLKMANPLVRSMRWAHRHGNDDFDLTEPGFVAEATSTRLYFLRGYRLRGYDFFHKHADAIRAFFTPVAEVRERAEAVVADARSRGDMLVGVHIRRGDYKTFYGGKWFYEVEQYAAVMRAVAALNPDRRVVFLICSDEKQSVEAFDGLEVKLGAGRFIDELHMLSCCDYVLGPPSTFSRWAAFHGRTPLYILDEPTPPADMAAFQVPLH